MARLFLPSGITITTVQGGAGTHQVSAVTLAGGLYLFGPDGGRLNATIALTPQESAAIMATVEAAAERHWQAMSAAYESSMGDPGADDVEVPPLVGA